MGFFDSVGSGLSGLFGNTDPARAAQIRGGMLGAAQALLQPYSGFGNAFVGAGQGAQQAKGQYLDDQYRDLRTQQLQQQLTQQKAQREALNNMFLGTKAAGAAPGVAPQAGGLDPEGSPVSSYAPPPTAAPQQSAFKLPLGFDTPEQFQAYAQIDPEGAMKRMFPEHKLTGYGAGQHVYDETGKEAFAVPDKPNPNQPFNPDGSANAAYQAYEKAKAAAAQAPQWANVEIARQNAANKTSSAFTPEDGALMGALAERGVSLPTGFRSKEQQKTMYQGILARNPGKSPDEIADLIKKGSIELGAQKKETQTAAAIVGKVEVFQNEIEEFAPLVRESLAKVPRGNFVPLNRLMQMAETSISDPNLKVLKGRINALLNAYDGLASRGGTDVDKRAHARALLTSADGPEAALAQLDNFLTEAAAAKRAAIKATKVPELAAETTAPPPKINAADLPANAKMQLKAGTVTTFKNGSKWTLKDGKPVQVQ